MFGLKQGSRTGKYGRDWGWYSIFKGAILISGHWLVTALILGSTLLLLLAALFGSTMEAIGIRGGWGFVGSTSSLRYMLKKMSLYIIRTFWKRLAFMLVIISETTAISFWSSLRDLGGEYGWNLSSSQLSLDFFDFPGLYFSDAS